MKKWIKSSKSAESLVEKNTIEVTIYLKPVIYADSDVILGSVYYNKNDRKYHTDVNPSREINGPLSDYGQMLEPPIEGEYEEFLRDCKWLIRDFGFTIIKSTRSTDSQKSEYVVLFGIDDTPYGKLIYNLRISDHPFDVTFPEDLKEDVLDYLKVNKILDNSATKAGIDFTIEKITVGSIKHDTWDKAFNRLFVRLKNMEFGSNEEEARDWFENYSTEEDEE